MNFETYRNELSVSRRQLCAAIRMFFADEDHLAIETLVSAAYSTICDLKSKQGRVEVDDYCFRTFFNGVQGYRRGTPGYLTDYPETIEWIDELGGKLPITATSKYEDIKATVSPAIAREYWANINQVSKFMEYADRYAGTYSPEEHIGNLFLLMQAQASYLDLAFENFTTEGYVLWVYTAVDCMMITELPKKLQKMAYKIERLNGEERLSRCSEILIDVNKVLRDTAAARLMHSHFGARNRGRSDRLYFRKTLGSGYSRIDEDDSGEHCHAGHDGRWETDGGKEKYWVSPI